MPQSEKLLWEKLRRRQVLGFRFRRQYSVGGYIIDFYCPELRLAIEVDGDSLFQKGSQGKDHRRQMQVEALGIHFFE
jgi:very-short-patch-repair endonuclease